MTDPKTIGATLADIQRLELKIDQLNDRLDTLLMEGGRRAGGDVQDVMNAVLAQTARHPAMNTQTQDMLRQILGPVIKGFDTENES